MKVIEFVKNELNDYTEIVFEFEQLDEFGKTDYIDEEYSFEGKPSEFIEKYTIDYDCIDDIELLDLDQLNIQSISEARKKVYMKYSTY